MSFPMQAQTSHISAFKPPNAVSPEQQASPGSPAPTLHLSGPRMAMYHLPLVSNGDDVGSCSGQASLLVPHISQARE